MAQHSMQGFTDIYKKELPSKHYYPTQHIRTAIIRSINNPYYFRTHF